MLRSISAVIDSKKLLISIHRQFNLKLKVKFISSLLLISGKTKSTASVSMSSKQIFDLCRLLGPAFIVNYLLIVSLAVLQARPKIHIDIEVLDHSISKNLLHLISESGSGLNSLLARQMVILF